jgi:hypothetical protein
MSGFIFNPYWQTANWFIDPVNGSDGYTGTNSVFTSGTTGPLKTWGELQGRWGTPSPRLQQNTTITFMNSQPDNTDPVYFNPYMENGALVILQGTLGANQQIATGTISATGFVVKNRATATQLQANTGATAVNQLVLNTTHSSYAWVSKLVSGSVYMMSQPMAPTVIPPVGFLGSGAAVDTWASGDTVTVYQPPTVHFASVQPQLISGNASFTSNGMIIYQLTVLGGAATNLSAFTTVNPFVSFVECTQSPTINGTILIATSSTQGSNAPFSINSVFQSLGGGSIGSFINIIAGRIDFGLYNSALELSNDVWVSKNAGSNGFIIGCNVVAILGSVYIDTALNLTGHFRGDVALGNPATTLILWGPGSLNLRANARLTYPSGAGAAAAAFLLTGGMNLNGQTGAWLVKTSATPTAGKTLTAANLDTDLGATIGSYLNPGGGCITNGGT